MKRNIWLVVGAAATLAVAGLTVLPSAFAGNNDTSSPSAVDPSQQSLRDLAARHGLYFGTAVDVSALNDSTDPQYRSLVASQFSMVTAENVMKWQVLEPTQGVYDWSQADQLVAFAQANGQRVRGHVLTWQNQLPTWLTSGVANNTISDSQLRDLLHKHITDVVTHFRGKIWQWDVVNEAVSDPWDSPPQIHLKGFWAQHLGPGYIADAFRWARAADPDALLFYNDYNIEAFGNGGPSDKTTYVYNMVKDLRAQDVPIDGVGSQGHLDTQYGNYDAFQISSTLDKFASLGVATAFTEVDARSVLTPAVQANSSAEINPRLQASAENFSVLLQGCLASRHCLSFTVWGFTDKHSWVPGWFKNPPEGLATLYDTNYQPKRAYNVVRFDLALAGPPLVLPRIPQQPFGSGADQQGAQ
jgi:endo-1,4-beta-xylanase